MKSSIPSKINAIVIATTLAMGLIVAVNTCAAKEQSPIAVCDNINAVHQDRTLFGQTKLDSKRIDDSDPVLIAQAPAMWCYTNYGPYPMAVLLTPGAVCQVNVLFYPYLIYGIAGY